MATESLPTPSLDRAQSIKRLHDTPSWDIVVIGGGATGLGIAVDASLRGYRTLLLERHDFAKGTSSRSTKLVHGGVRYLAMGDIKLVYSALRERGILFKNAGHLAHAQSFVIPCYSVFSKLKYLVGLKIYDWLAGKYRIGKSSLLSSAETAKRLPGVKTTGLKGGVQYFDGQFDDARLAVNLAQTAAQHGATLLNYCEVVALTKSDTGKLKGLTCVDGESEQTYTINATCVINATGVFVDDVLHMDTDSHRPLVRPSQGAHIVLDNTFLGQQDALMIPKTSDGRVLFGVPWHDHMVLGTTDTPITESNAEPFPLEQEIQFILDTAASYLVRAPRLSDVKSMFAGLRPLAAPQNGEETTKEISRDHKLLVSESGLVTITGGKWTTYRQMAEETIDKAIEVVRLPRKACVTMSTPIHGRGPSTVQGHWKIYGTDAPKIMELAAKNVLLRERLHPKFAHIGAEVAWACRHEMARTVEDVLARRLRILFLDASTSIQMAPKVATILAYELGRNEEWAAQQVEDYTRLAKNYLPFESGASLIN